jgi:hypothetical protein
LSAYLTNWHERLIEPLELGCLGDRQSAWHDSNECPSSVTGLRVPLRVLCPLTRENWQPCRPVGDRRVATARLAGQNTGGRGSQAVAWRASAVGGCRTCTRCMGAMREELYHLVDLPPASIRSEEPGVIVVEGRQRAVVRRQRGVRTGGRLSAAQAWEADLGGRDMRVVRAAEFGGHEVLIPGKAPEPAAGPGQVVVEVSMDPDWWAAGSSLIPPRAAVTWSGPWSR